MKRQLITYILAAFCAAAILSCNKEKVIDVVGPDSECTILLTATIDASTKGVSIDESKVVCTWEVDDAVKLVLNKEVISTLKVISVDGNKAQLSGKVKGTYAANADTPMTLYYGGTEYDYSGQTGTAESAVSKAYMTAKTYIKTRSADGKTLTLESVEMKHQQAYIGLTFYKGAERVNVKSVVITGGGANIVKTRKPLATEPADTLTIYGDTKFTMTSEGGQDAFYFALRDTTTRNNPAPDHKYTLKILTASNDEYTGIVAAPYFGDNGNYFTDSKVILERLSPVITAPTIYSSIKYDGFPHNLITPAEVRSGVTVEYCVSDTYPTDNYEGWSTSIPTRVDMGSYKVWYKVAGGDDYESILTTNVGTTVIRAEDYATIVPPTSLGNFTYSATSHQLVNPGYLKVNDSTTGPDLEYFVKTNSIDPPASNDPSWSTTIPEKTNAGTYYIWYRQPGNQYSYLPAMEGPVTVTIARKDLTITAKNQTLSSGHISNDKSDSNIISISGLLSGHSLDSITFTPLASETASVDQTISLKDAVIIVTGSNPKEYVTSNYIISYVDGKVVNN